MLLQLAAQFRDFSLDLLAALLLEALHGVLRLIQNLRFELGGFDASFVALGADTRYFGEHVEVDTDEHAAWMAESVEDVLDIYGPAASEAITAGMIDAWQETREVPDALWRKQCASH